LSGTPRQIATRLRQEVADQVGLTITVGVARTKFLAKVASTSAKPDGLLVVPPEAEDEFLHPLAIERLWGVGPATAKRLQARGITTVGDVASLSKEALVAMLGRCVGESLGALAHNEDPRPVTNDHHRRSVGAQAARPASSWSVATTDAVVLQLVDTVTARLRAAGVAGRTVSIRLRFGDFTRASRSHTIPVATANTTTVLAVVRSLVAEARPTIEQKGLTLLGVTVANLSGPSRADHPHQLSLESVIFDEGNLVANTDGADKAIDAVIDQVRNRFGPGAITRATLVSR
ncbi:MAG: DNA polymerase IV, partial [Pseudonocardiaceae bacterium]